MRVTFDSNVWRVVTDPANFPNDPEINDVRKIHSLIRQKKIIPCLSETTFTYEAIKKVDRKIFFANYKAIIETEELPVHNGMIGFQITIKPNDNYHPGNNSFLTEHLRKALSLGFKVLRCVRTGGIVNPDLKSDMFIEEPDNSISNRLDLFGIVVTKIENSGAGYSQIVSLGESYSSMQHDWKEGLKIATDSENGIIAKAIAEWADGDAIAAHIAYGNDYFCTRDISIGAGSKSVLSESNKEWLKNEFNLKVVSIKELAEIIQ